MHDVKIVVNEGQQIEDCEKETGGIFLRSSHVTWLLRHFSQFSAIYTPFGVLVSCTETPPYALVNTLTCISLCFFIFHFSFITLNSVVLP